MRVLRLFAVLLLAALAARAQERGKVGDLRIKIIDLQYRVTDLAGNPVNIAGRVEDIQVRETPTEITIDLAADVLFDFDKADVLPKAEDTLRKAADLIRGRARGAVRIEGHTDAKGDDAYNMRLSERRAASVRDWLARNGNLGAVQFQTAGRGETQPVAPNNKPDGSDDPEGRQKNRRVQIVMRKVG